METPKILLRNNSKAISLSFLPLQLSQSLDLPSKKTLWRKPHEPPKLLYKVIISAFLLLGHSRCSHMQLPSRPITNLFKSIPTFSNTHLRQDLHIQAPPDLASHPILVLSPLFPTSANPHPHRFSMNVPVKPLQPNHHPHPAALVYPPNADLGQPKKRTRLWPVSIEFEVPTGLRSSPCLVLAVPSTNPSKTATKSS